MVEDSIVGWWGIEVGEARAAIVVTQRIYDFGNTVDISSAGDTRNLLRWIEDGLHISCLTFSISF